jgi:integrase
VAALLAALDADPQPRRRTDWMQRDRALILTALLAGLRADELVRANVGDVRRTDDGVIHVRGKGGKDRRIPIEPALVQVLERYLDGRATRFPATAKRRSSPGGGLVGAFRFGRGYGVRPSPLFATQHEWEAKTLVKLPPYFSSVTVAWLPDAKRWVLLNPTAVFEPSRAGDARSALPILARF